MITAEEHRRITAVAQSDPLVGLTRQLGERIADARRETDRLVGILAHIDDLRERLRQDGVVVDVDLGTTGNAAAAARRSELSGVLPRFTLPRAASG